MPAKNTLGAGVTGTAWRFFGWDLALVSFCYGLERQDRFEIMVISTDWLALLINGILVSLVFRKRIGGR